VITRLRSAAQEAWSSAPAASYNQLLSDTHTLEIEPEMSTDDVAAQLEQLHAAAFGWALSCCGWDRPAAEDVLQASYLKILDGRARFDGRSAFRTWLFGVIRRSAAEARRRAVLWRWLPLARLLLGPQGADERADSETALVRADEAARLAGALARLPTRQREVLHLVFYEDLTIAEAASVLGVALGTARTHYERGKSALRRMLKEHER
jgi:RNA polymerase sigma-70 factor (ECF subfamily)